MKKTSPYQYLSLPRVNEGGVRKYSTPDGRVLPSVTTILSATKDTTELDAWKLRVGEQEATRVVTEATDIGSAMHDNLEQYVLNQTPPKGTLIVKALTNMMITKALCGVDEVWGTEVGLYTSGLWAGTTDLVGIHCGTPAIMDFKNSTKPKQKAWISDYFMQICAYANSHNEMFGTNISKGVIMIACRSGEYQEYVIEGDEFTHYEMMWCNKVVDYYRALEA